jgi:hypothetical protein
MSGNRGNPWTPEEDEILIRCARGGHTATTIPGDLLPRRTRAAMQARILHHAVNGQMDLGSAVFEEARRRKAAQRGSEMLRQAIVAYARKHYPNSDLARRAA